MGVVLKINHLQTKFNDHEDLLIKISTNGLRETAKDKKVSNISQIQPHFDWKDSKCENRVEKAVIPLLLFNYL